MRYATKYLDTTGTLGSSIPDFEWGRTPEEAIIWLIKRAQEEALHVVQGGHVDSCTAKTKLWTIRRRRNRSRKSCWPLCVGELWLQAMIFRFDAIVRLVYREMDQIFCEHMLCIRIHSMLCSVQELIEEQGESGLCLLPHLSRTDASPFLSEEDVSNSTQSNFSSALSEG